MDNFDDYFKTLGEINQVERDKICCEIRENYEYTIDGVIVTNDKIINVKSITPKIKVSIIILQFNS